MEPRAGGARMRKGAEVDEHLRASRTALKVWCVPPPLLT